MTHLIGTEQELNHYLDWVKTFGIEPDEKTAGLMSSKRFEIVRYRGWSLCRSLAAAGSIYVNWSVLFCVPASSLFAMRSIPSIGVAPWLVAAIAAKLDR